MQQHWMSVACTDDPDAPGLPAWTRFDYPTTSAAG
jgi:hypothetical protein